MCNIMPDFKSDLTSVSETYQQLRGMLTLVTKIKEEVHSKEWKGPTLTVPQFKLMGQECEKHFKKSV